MQSEKLSPLSGEFVNVATEQTFQAERFPETLRHAKLCFIAAAILNTCFFISDWRFYGESHFFIAIPSRAAVVAISLICLALVYRAADGRQLQRVWLLWQAVVAAGVGLLVSSHTEIALFVVILLPSIFYLVVPTTFWLKLAMGIACSVIMLAGFMLPDIHMLTAPGLILAMVMLNTALVLAVSHSNRLRRLEWSATQAERRLKEELAESRSMFEKMFMSVPVPLLVTAHDDGCILKVNDAANSFFGSDATSTMRIQDIYVEPQDRAKLMKALADTGRIAGFETTIRVSDGSIRDVLIAATSVRYGDVDAVMASAVDISARRVLERRLEHLATTDSLTGLLNRGHFQHTAGVEMERSRRYGRALSLLMVDIDHFKSINDTHGHVFGDRVLVAFSKLCSAHLRMQDSIARFGGEEFAILLPETDELAAVSVAERFRECVQGLKIEDGPELQLSVSIGITGIDVTADTFEDAVTRADVALYAAKRQGRNCVVFYTDNMQAAGAA